MKQLPNQKSKLCKRTRNGDLQNIPGETTGIYSRKFPNNNKNKNCTSCILQ